MSFSQYASSFADHLRTYLPSEITTTPTFLQAVDEHLRELDCLATLETSQARIEKLNLKLAPENIRERLISLDNGRLLIAGGRFKALNPDFPFIEVTANFTIDKEMVAEIKALVQKEFETLRPKGFKFSEKPELDLQCETWNSVLFGSTKQTDSKTELHFRWPTDFTNYDVYKERYLKNFLRNPHLKGIVRIEDEEDLKDAASQGRLMEAVDENENFIGLIAGQDSPFYGVNALYIFELFITPENQGKGLAKEMQRAYLGQLNSRFPFVWGHINSKNQASLKTAQAVGRKIIQTECFISCENR